MTKLKTKIMILLIVIAVIGMTASSVSASVGGFCKSYDTYNHDWGLYSKSTYDGHNCMALTGCPARTLIDIAYGIDPVTTQELVGSCSSELSWCFVADDTFKNVGIDGSPLCGGTYKYIVGACIY